MKTVTIKQMRELDAFTIGENNISGIELMKLAGVGAAEHILKYIESINLIHLKRFVILAGKGNNGGDGFVIANYLSEHSDIDIVIYSLSSISKLTPESKYHAEVSKKIAINHLNNLKIDFNFKSFSIVEGEAKPFFKKGDIIVDALLGTGAQGSLRTPYDEWINIVNQSNLPTISIDIPSGLNGDTGRVVSDAILADLTLTIGAPKCGLVLKQADHYCGIIKCVDIGIPSIILDGINNSFDIFFQSDVTCLNRRLSTLYKNNNGHVLIIGGSSNYHGASILAAKAAMRSGAGIVTVAVPKSANIRSISMDSLIIRGVSDSGGGYFSKESSSQLSQLAEMADSIVIGPGMTTNQSVIKMMENLSINNKTIIWDADALNILALNPSLLNKKCLNICTPHVGEMKRLLLGFKLSEYSSDDRMALSEAFSKKSGAITVLKGKNSVVSGVDQKSSINSSGSSALATAGSGDVLTGIIGAFIASGIEPFDATKCAVFIHGFASELSHCGIRGFSADDLITLIPEAMKEISPFG